MKRHNRHNGRRKKIIILLISIELLLIVVGLTFFLFRPVVAEAVTVEAGDHMVDVKEFLLNKEKEGIFLTDIKSLNTSIPGIYEIKIQVGDKIHTSMLEVVDTIAPTATVTDQHALRGEVVDPKVFVVEMSDATQVNLTFKETPDTSQPGKQEVTIILEDSGKNRIEKKAMLTVLDVKSSVTIEAGSVMNITVADFMNNQDYDAFFITDIQKLDISKPISHQIELSINDKIVTGHIEVVDTTAPKASVQNQQVWLGEKVEPIVFIKNIDDVSKVDVTYKIAPDFNKLGEQPLTLLLRDSSGNTTELPVLMTVLKDTQAPEFQGLSDKFVYIGDSVSYKKGVTVTDNRDKELSFAVDSSNVKLKKEGIYTVTYSATDAAGNKPVRQLISKLRNLQYQRIR